MNDKYLKPVSLYTLISVNSINNSANPNHTAVDPPLGIVPPLRL